MSGSVTDILDAQHRRVAQLFEDVSDPAKDRPAVLHTLLEELAAHVAAERSQVEPVVKSRSIGGDELASQLADDYARIEQLMVLIERRKFNSPDIPELVTELKDAFAEHIARCDRSLLPGLGSELSDDESAELGDRVSKADNLVVTHPHPHLLSLGAVSAKLAGLLARFDWLRDRTHQPRASDDNDPSMGGAT